MRVSKIHKLPVSKARIMFTNLENVIKPDEVVCITKKKPFKSEVLAIMHWELFEFMLDVLKTVEDPYLMMEFSKFVKDKKVPHPFTDMLKPYYDSQGFVDAQDDLLPELPKFQV